MTYSVDPDQMQCSVASDLGLHYLWRPVCPSTKGYYSIGGNASGKQKFWGHFLYFSVEKCGYSNEYT